MPEFDVVIYKIVAKAKAKVKAKNWRDAKKKTQQVAKESSFEPHEELRMIMDFGE